MAGPTLEALKALEFMECDSCRAKLGSPILCGACTHNQRVVMKLQEHLMRPGQKINIKCEGDVYLSGSADVPISTETSEGSMIHTKYTGVFYLCRTFET